MNYSEDLKAYLDGELDLARSTEMERELASNADLRAELADLKKVGDSIKAMALQPEALGLEQTLAALNRKPSNRHSFTFPWLWGSGLATVAALVVVVVLWPGGDANVRAKATANGAVAMSDAKSADASASAASSAQKLIAPLPKMTAMPSPAPKVPLELGAKPVGSVPRTKRGAESPLVRKKETHATAPSDLSKFVADVHKVPVALSSVHAESAIQTVVVACNTLQEGQDKVRKIMDRYALTTTPTKLQLSMDANPHSAEFVEVEVPADQLDSIVSEAVSSPTPGPKFGLAAPAEKSKLSANRRRPGTGGAMGGMGRSAYVPEADRVSAAKSAPHDYLGLKNSPPAKVKADSESSATAKKKAETFANSAVVSAIKPVAGELGKGEPTKAKRRVRFVFKLTPDKKPVP